MRARARPLICISAFALRPCSLLALLLYLRSWKRSGNGDNEGGECPDDPEIICGESFWQFSLCYSGNKQDKELKHLAWYLSAPCDAKGCPEMLLSSLRAMGTEASSSCDRPSCVDGYKIVKLANSPRKKSKRSVPQREYMFPLSPGGTPIMFNKIFEKMNKQSKPPQPPQPPRSLEEQTEIAGEKERAAQKNLEHAKKVAENEPKNQRLAADVETYTKSCSTHATGII